MWYDKIQSKILSLRSLTPRIILQRTGGSSVVWDNTQKNSSGLIESKEQTIWYFCLLDKINVSCSHTCFLNLWVFLQFFLILTPRFMSSQYTTHSVFESYNVQLRTSWLIFSVILICLSHFSRLLTCLNIPLLLIHPAYKAIGLLLYGLMVQMHYHSVVK